MPKNSMIRGLSLVALVWPWGAQADFFADSKANLELRNFYFNRDFRQPGGSAGQSKQDEWAQGFILRYESGFTEGPVGFGIDAISMLGTRLDSGKGSGGTGLLPVRSEGGGPSEYGKVEATLKMRLSKTVARFGAIIPQLPTVMASDLRLLPQTFRGGQLISNEINGLTLNAGRLTRTIQRNSSGAEELSMVNRGMKGLSSTDQFDFFSASYQWTNNLTTSYNYADLKNNYHQNYFTLNHSWALSKDQVLKTDVRYARSSNDGQTNVDNRALGALFTYRIDHQSFGLGYQKMTGKTGFAYLNGTNPHLVNFVQIWDFDNPDEKSWQARYDYDFSGWNLPGLTFMTRYVSGRDFDRADGSHGKEWERDMDLGYVFQSGVVKNLGIKWRNATFRSNGNGNDLDENRLIVSYTIPLL